MRGKNHSFSSDNTGTFCRMPLLKTKVTYFPSWLGMSCTTKASTPSLPSSPSAFTPVSCQVAPPSVEICQQRVTVSMRICGTIAPVTPLSLPSSPSAAPALIRSPAPLSSHSLPRVQYQSPSTGSCATASWRVRGGVRLPHPLLDDHSSAYSSFHC